MFAESRGMLKMEADTNKGVKSIGFKMFGFFCCKDKSMWVVLRYVLCASKQSDLLFLLQVSGNMGILCLCDGLTWFVWTPARANAFHHDHEVWKMCVCSRTSLAEKSINTCLKQRKSYPFLLVKLGLFSTFIKIDNQPSIHVKICIFVSKLRLARAYFHLFWSLLANWPEICIISFCSLNPGIFSHLKEQSLDHGFAYQLHD